MFDFLSEHPGVWSDRELAARIFCSTSSIKRGLRALKLKGLVETAVTRKKLGGWWIKREVRIVKKNKENR